jgi:hydrogenase maturation protease
MSGELAPMVVIGVGNTFLRDDGVGVRVVECLERLATFDPMSLPAHTRLVDGGTLDMDLLRVANGARALLLVDGVDLDLAPGSIEVLRGDAITAAGGQPSGSASGGVGELLAIANLMGWLNEPVALVGIQVADVGFGGGLSPHVEAALPLAVEAARHELFALDQEVGRRANGLAPTAGAGRAPAGASA